MGDYANAVSMPCTNFFPGRSGLKPKYVIIHGTAGGTSAQTIARNFQNSQGGTNPVASNYITDQAGVIVQCVAESDGAWANGSFSSGHDTFWDTSINPNLITISIEHVKAHSDNSDALTTVQQVASFALVKDICQRQGIPMRKADKTGGITGHFSIDPVNKSRCPGNYPWDALFTYLNSSGGGMLDITDPLVARYFRDGGNGTWICTNGVTLQGAPLTFYRSNGGPALFGLPLSNEIYPSQYPKTAIVPCERAMIVFDAGRIIDKAPMPGQCYLLHLDSGIGQQLLTDNATAPLRAQIQTLNAKLVELQNGNSAYLDLKSKVKQIQTLVAGV